ncbi:MAG TPA: beta-galactosidase GalA [Verrucomicrobiae bacterium]|nr:beta-galactosidase GalA [Verrucomicrobiae bacterium]
MALFCGALAAAPRQITSLDFDWRFHRGDVPGVLRDHSTNGNLAPTPEFLSPAYDDSSWQTVDVPHDYIVKGAFDPKADEAHGYLPVEPGWYRKAISIPAADQDRRLWLEFDGVYRDSQMWLNGHFLGRHVSGYTSFRYDISEVAKPGAKNLLVVRVDPTRFEGWWYEGGGIYRHTRLVSVAPIHVAPWGVQVVARMNDPGDGVQADAQLQITTTLANDAADGDRATVLNEVIDADGTVVATGQTAHRLATNGSFDFRQSLALSRANLWSCEHPYLYRLRTSVLVRGQTVDQITTDFGVRTIRFDANRGFFLNGKPVKIKGTCNHQDFAGVGVALPDRLYEFRVQKLKEMGANAMRLSHNEMAPELLDACDRLGVLVMAENRHLDDSPEILGQLENLVRRDRNHPSIVLWSISNEEKEQGSELGAKQGRAMVNLIRQLDGTRPVTAAMNNGIGHGLTGVIDVQGFNYHPDTYDEVHREFPKMPLIATEIAAAVGTRGCYARDLFTVPKDTARYQGNAARCQVAAYDVNAPDWAETAEQAWQAVAERPWMAGGFVWAGFDYRGEPTPFEWPAVSSQYAILDTCGFPKDVYYYYQSWWTAQPVLHFFPHWNWPGQEDKAIDVWCYSNCKQVELFLNGQSLGRKTMPQYSHLEWSVKYAPGTLSAKGYDSDGKVIAETRVETTGEPAAIVLEPDRTNITADGEDISLVTVKIVDAQGRTVPVATNEVTFSVTGAGHLLGLGNGDPSCHEPDKGNQRSAFNGLCLAIVQSSRTPGAITIQAHSSGLKAAAAVIEARETESRQVNKPAPAPLPVAANVSSLHLKVLLPEKWADLHRLLLNKRERAPPQPAPISVIAKHRA